jgi:hypothetical protein
LSTASVADQVEELRLPDPVAAALVLRSALAGVVDPRGRRGVGHGLLVVLTSAVCAVAAGARSFVAIAEWVADLPAELPPHDPAHLVVPRPHGPARAPADEACSPVAELA